MDRGVALGSARELIPFGAATQVCTTPQGRGGGGARARGAGGCLGRRHGRGEHDILFTGGGIACAGAPKLLLDTSHRSAPWPWHGRRPACRQTALQTFAAARGSLASILGRGDGCVGGSHGHHMMWQLAGASMFAIFQAKSSNAYAHHYCGVPYVVRCWQAHWARRQLFRLCAAPLAPVAAACGHARRCAHSHMLFCQPGRIEMLRICSCISRVLGFSIMRPRARWPARWARRRWCGRCAWRPSTAAAGWAPGWAARRPSTAGASGTA